MREKKTTKKQKKPFYKRTWFIVLAVFLVIAGIGGANSKKSDGNDPDRVDSQVSQATSSESSSETKNTETIETDTSGFTQDDHVYMMTISQKILDQYLTDYDTPWNDDDWTFAKFDENKKSDGLYREKTLLCIRRPTVGRKRSGDTAESRCSIPLSAEDSRRRSARRRLENAFWQM